MPRLYLLLPLFAATALAAEPTLRQQWVTDNGLPPGFAKVAASPTEDGPALFAGHCTGCHGETGKGDGEEGFYYPMQPPDFSAVMNHPVVDDAYLRWTISAGGPPVGSPMPAFGTQLAPAQIEALVQYLQSHW